MRLSPKIRTLCSDKLQTVNHRSKTVLLVKNLPSGTRVDEIRELFSKYGVLGRVILPPHGITSTYPLFVIIERVEREGIFRVTIV